MYKINSNGPNIEPWWTPHLMDPKLDFTPSYVTHWDLLDK